MSGGRLSGGLMSYDRRHIHYIYIYHFMYVCVRVCVHASMPGDITVLTAEMGFLESVFEDH